MYMDNANYLEGCNILLQILMIEHIRPHHFTIEFKVEWNDYIRCHKKSIAYHNFEEDIGA